MSTRNLEFLCRPRSVALIGASADNERVGGVTRRNLLRAGFGGPVFLVNPHHSELDGKAVHASVAALPQAPDLAIIATPPDSVPALIAELGARGTKAAVVITAGFSELGPRGKALEQQALDAAQPHLLRLLGPNCVGLMVPAIGLDASFSHRPPLSGDLAFLSQSGAMITAMLDWAAPRGIGFSHVVSFGDMADVDFGDMIAYLAADETTRAILLYVEGLTEARKFLTVARKAALTKPVLAVKVGRFAESAQAARSHTGALAGSDAIYDAALRRAGILRVGTMAELFGAAETLALTQEQQGEGLVILTNGGGPGVLATDALIEMGGKLAALSPVTLAALDAVLPRTWSRGNPVDIIGDAPGSRYAAALDILLQAPEADAILALNCPTALGAPSAAAEAVIASYDKAQHAGRTAGRNLFTAWLGEEAAAPARRLFASARIATYDMPDEAVRGFMHRVRHRRNQRLLSDSADALPAVTEESRLESDRRQARLQQSPRRWLEAEEVAALLAAYFIPQPLSQVVRDPVEAERVAGEIGRPVALKIRSPDLTHKSDVGGVALNLGSPARVRAEAEAMLARIAAAQPAARLDGFLLQEMVLRPGARELIVGLTQDRTFGPVLLFGQGGVAVELLGDSSLELAPVTVPVAKAQMARTRIWRLLQAYRGQPAADLEAIAAVLVAIGRLAVEHPEISELDINPLLADASGVLALDCRIAVTVTADATS